MYAHIYTYIYTNTHAHVLISCALCTMSMLDPCHALRNPTNIVGEIGLPRFQTECWAIPILCMPAHEHHDGYWMRQMNISNTISKDCNPICQIVPLHWHYIDMNIYSYTHLVVIAIAFFYSNNPSGEIPATFILHRYPHISGTADWLSWSHQNPLTVTLMHTGWEPTHQETLRCFDQQMCTFLKRQVKINDIVHSSTVTRNNSFKISL